MSVLHKCCSEEERTKYKADNATQLARFEEAYKVVNSSKKADVALHKAVDLQLEIKRQERLKKQIAEKTLKPKQNLEDTRCLKKTLIGFYLISMLKKHMRKGNKRSEKIIPWNSDDDDGCLKQLLLFVNTQKRTGSFFCPSIVLAEAHCQVNRRVNADIFIK